MKYFIISLMLVLPSCAARRVVVRDCAHVNLSDAERLSIKGSDVYKTYECEYLGEAKHKADNAPVHGVN